MLKFSHAIVFVSDMAQSVTFYRDVLGLAVRFESPKWTEFEAAGCTLALHRADTSDSPPSSPDSIRAGVCHLSFSADNLDAFHQQMVAKGVVCLQPPQEEDFGGRLAGYADPDDLPFWVGEKSKKS